MPRKATAIDYQKLFFATVRDRYFSLIIGMLVAFVISFVTYKTLLSKIPLKISFSLPKINLSLFTKKSHPIVKKTVNRQPKTYVIQEGDDLWHIAEKFYGSGFNAYDISLANKISNPSALSAGQKIIIPVVTPRQPTVGDIATGAATSKVVYTEGKYVVEPGDSLSIIAGKVYGDINAWPRIMQANNLNSPNDIDIGTILVIPR